MMQPMFLDNNTGNNIAPFSVLYKGYTVSRSGDGYVVNALGNRKRLGQFSNPQDAQLYVDALTKSGGVGELSASAGSKFAIGLGIALVIGHYLTRSK